MSGYNADVDFSNLISNPALMLTAMLGIGFLAQWLAWRVRLPAILPLLLIGLVLGPFLGVVDPDELLGDLLFPAVSLAVAIILFEGSVNLRFDELSGIGHAVRRLVSYGAVVAVLGLAAAAHWVAGLSWPLSFLFGALTCVTGPTVVNPMLRTVRPNAKVNNLLRWEGIVIDPIGALLAVLIYEIILSKGFQGHSIWMFMLTISASVAIGAGAAMLLVALLKRQFIPEYLQSYATLALVLVAFSFSNTITHESGLLAVTVMGIVLGNSRNVHIDLITNFKEDLSILLVSMLFIILAARLPWPLPAGTLTAGLLIYLAAQLVIRPLSIWVATLRSSLSIQERLLVAWISPRGIVAASVSALFALQLEALGMPGADRLVPLVFILIIATVVVQSITAGPLARLLGVREPEPHGVLIFGVNPVARAIAISLHKQEIPVLMAGDDWEGIRSARMEGLKTYFGNPTSQHADNYLDHTGLGRLLAMSTQREMNSLTSLHYRQEFGRDKVYRLRNLAADESSERAAFAHPLLAPALFGEDMTNSRFQDLLAKGWKIKTTTLTETYAWPKFVEAWGSDLVLLFLITEKGVLRMASSKRELDPKPGVAVTALVPPKEEAAQEAAPDTPPVQESSD